MNRREKIITAIMVLFLAALSLFAIFGAPPDNPDEGGGITFDDIAISALGTLVIFLLAIVSEPALSKRVFSEKRPHLIPALIAALMLFGALGRWPYGYYLLLRFVTCGAVIFITFMGYNWKKLWAAWLFGFIAVLFNPLIKIHFHKGTWQVIDIIVAVLFIVSLFAIRPSKNKSH